MEAQSTIEKENPALVMNNDMKKRSKQRGTVGGKEGTKEYI